VQAFKYDLYTKVDKPYSSEEEAELRSRYLSLMRKNPRGALTAANIAAR
jgi:hypothetical protein